MNESANKLLNLMFRPSENICVSYNKYGYHSVPLKNVLNNETVVLVPTEDSCERRGISWDEGREERFAEEMKLVALNPIDGYREDENCTAYRNFLVEIDDGTSAEQVAYVKKLELPYSASIFSGNKSMHFLISLSQDLPDEKSWRMVAEWILNIVTLADPLTKNPSRSIRIPGVWREPKKLQRLAEIEPAISLKTLMDWLNRHPEAKPAVFQKKTPSEDFQFNKVKPWVISRLKNGLDRTKGRNQQWYAIAYEFALAGYPEHGTIEFLSRYFSPERDFKEREWKITLKSAFKRVHSGK